VIRGWQFSRAAVIAREATAWLVGPVVVWLLYGPKVRGREHLRQLEHPFLLCPSHASHLDFSAVRLALRSRHRRRIAAAVAADYFTVSPLRWFFAAWLGAFPFNRSGRGGHESIDEALALLQSGWSVLVFPEGTRSRTGAIAPFRPGIGLIAIRSGRQVLPVRILNIHRVLPPGALRPHRARVEVRFGEPLRADAGENPRAFTGRLEAAVRALGDDSQ
jgi:1-acyl-sn-glycerol-3-phosphate acyltransferase